MTDIKCKNCAGAMSEYQSKCDWCGTNYESSSTPYKRINAEVLTAMIKMDINRPRMDSRVLIMPRKY